MTKGILGAVGGGVLGAVVWAAITIFTGYEIGWIAWLVGAGVGFGMAVGSRGEGGMAGGVAAAAIALISIAAGKYIAVRLEVGKVTDRIVAEAKYSVDDAKIHLAWELVEEAKEQGQTLKWPKGQEPGEGDDETVESLADFPKSIAKDVETRWGAMTPEAAETYRSQLEAQMQHNMRSMAAAITSRAFESSFNAFDILWGILAVLSAFKLGSGAGGDD